VLFHYITWQVLPFPVDSSERQDMKDNVFPAIWGDMCFIFLNVNYEYFIRVDPLLATDQSDPQSGKRRLMS
jgi:hypothetical protein